MFILKQREGVWPEGLATALDIPLDPLHAPAGNNFSQKKYFEI